MRKLTLELEDSRGLRPIEFTATSMVNLGYVGRNEAAVRHHIEELAREGVPPPASIPLKIPMPLSTLSFDAQIDVSSEKTSGEVEVAFLLQDEKVYIGIGSDHTDRGLERTDMALSKQVCPNVLGARVWDFDEVKDDWDGLEIKSWAAADGGCEILYQSSTLGSMLPAQRMIDCARAALRRRTADGLIVYSGTVGILNSTFVYASGFRCELFNPATQRRLRCEYEVRTLASIFEVA